MLYKNYLIQNLIKKISKKLNLQEGIHLLMSYTTKKKRKEYKNLHKLIKIPGVGSYDLELTDI
jgi:hypothetical protein